MTCKVTLSPSRHEFAAAPDETVLDAAGRAGLMLPYGCRNGACGSCRGRVTAGRVDHGAAQAGALSEAERAQGWALLCCARPLTDVTVEVREMAADADYQPRTLPVRVQGLARLAPDVMEMTLKLPVTEKLAFRPGQYLDVLLKDGRRRSFSLANAPHDAEFLKLHVRHVPGGAFTGHVFNEMKEKAILRVQAPLGTFFLREESDKPIIFLATGTGFAPVKSIVEHALRQETDRQMVLYWGGRVRSDLYQAELAGQWQARRRNFTFIPVLSRPRPEDRWPGRTGYVTHAAARDFPDLSGYQVYACGSPDMVRDARALLLGQGLSPDDFFSDAFTYAPDAQPV